MDCFNTGSNVTKILQDTSVLRYVCDLNAIEIQCSIYDRITTRVKTASYDLKTAVLERNTMYKGAYTMPF